MLIIKNRTRTSYGTKHFQIKPYGSIHVLNSSPKYDLIKKLCLNKGAIDVYEDGVLIGEVVVQEPEPQPEDGVLIGEVVVQEPEPQPETQPEPQPEPEKPKRGRKKKVVDEPEQEDIVIETQEETELPSED